MWRHISIRASSEVGCAMVNATCSRQEVPLALPAQAARVDVSSSCASKTLRMSHMWIGDGGKSQKHHHPDVDQDGGSSATPLNEMGPSRTARTGTWSPSVGAVTWHTTCWPSVPPRQNLDGDGGSRWTPCEQYCKKNGPGSSPVARTGIGLPEHCSSSIEVTMAPPQDPFYTDILRALSHERLDGYRQHAPADKDISLLARYLWNVQLCEALYPAIQCLEVTLRNSIHGAATTTFGQADWYDTPGLLRPYQSQKSRMQRVSCGSTESRRFRIASSQN